MKPKKKLKKWHIVLLVIGIVAVISMIGSTGKIGECTKVERGN